MSLNFADAVQHNSGSWGPTAAVVPDRYQGSPYAPFSKSSPLGRVADFGGVLANSRYYRTRQWNRKKNVNSAFKVDSETEESGFKMVDNRQAESAKYQKNKWRQRYQDPNTIGFFARMRMYKGKERLEKKVGGNKRKRPKRNKRQRLYARRRYYWNRKRVKRDPSIVPLPTWSLLKTVKFTLLNNQDIDPEDEPEGETLVEFGELGTYTPKYANITARTGGVKLPRADQTTFFRVSTTDDPVIQALALGGAGQVFATDAILSALLCCTRSKFSWDIVVQRVGDKLFFDKRDNSPVDLLTVNETADSPPDNENGKQHVNAPKPLSAEAVVVNQAFSQIALDPNAEPIHKDHPNPFVTHQTNVAKVGYAYRSFELPCGAILIARCAVDAVNREGNPVCLRAMNEYTLRESNWRGTIDHQRGAVIGRELKNNSFKMARWTSEAILADASRIHVGFVSRNSPNDPTSHSLLAVESYNPRSLAVQTALSMRKAWATLDYLVKECLKLEDGKYVFVRDSDADVLHLYQVPLDSFEDADQVILDVDIDDDDDEIDVDRV